MEKSYEKSKWLALAGVAVLSVGILAACSSKSSTSGTTYGYVYSSDPETLDYITSNTGPTTTAVTNGVDGLMETDKYGNLVPSVAEDWSVSQDGLTYTYKIRKGVKWYTSDGEEYADVTAKDFVTGLKHAADSKAGALYLVQDSIAGLSDYLSGANKDFSKVGVKAIDDHTLQYTLKRPEPYWNSKTTYGLLFPVNADFLKTKGKDFGKSTDPTSILYNGPFLLKSLTAKSSIELTKNENYWDKKNVHFDAIKLTYDDGSDPESLERSFTDGAYSIARVYPMSSNYASVEKKYKDNIYYTAAGASTSAMSVNIDRQSYKYTAKKTDAEKTSTKKALLNKDFRQSINFAIDRTVYQSQVNGKEGAAKAIRNLFVPSDFVSAGNKTFGDLVTEKMSSYGDEWSGVNFADGQDGLYNAEKAKTEFSKAKEALQGEGVQFPIHLDLPVDQSSKLNVSQAQSLKQTIEKSLGSDNVVIDINQLSSGDMQNATLNAPNAAAAQVGLKDYDALLDSADSETTDLNVRYDRYAQAQAWLEDSSLVIPLTVGNGSAPVVSRLTPFTGSYTQVGDKSSGDYFKYVKPQEKVVTKKEFEQSREKWLKEKKVSNDKAQKDLAKHVK
ncbi:Oligopeptide ABC transporter, periplasmic oligopeptide-binding protein OppA [Streptococcus sp. HSISS2]|uniref:peptide ABC transporter substrate-binding protein n=1 Tax=Streptococcus sp. HSISS2 TaxID=1316411 RepID=UPI00038A9ACB|nr:Oligopeptide ABC transporter, periplasmic oligopeptide-binding protein OppA [Streptococcus sp. HSISS2]